MFATLLSYLAGYVAFALAVCTLLLMAWNKR